MTRNISYKRGVIINMDPRTGVEVFMYVDDPGVYLSAHGTPVAEELARAAGYDVAKFAKERKLKERLKQAHASIQKELEMESAKSDNRIVVKEKSGFKVVDIGIGRHIVQDPEGNVLHVGHLTGEQALILIDQLVPDPPPEPPKVKGPHIIKTP